MVWKGEAKFLLSIYLLHLGGVRLDLVWLDSSEVILANLTSLFLILYDCRVVLRVSAEFESDTFSIPLPFTHLLSMIQFLTPYTLNTSLASIIPQTLRYHTYKDDHFTFHYVSKTVRTLPYGDGSIWIVYTDIWMVRSPPTINLYHQNLGQYSATPVAKGDYHPCIIIVNQDKSYDHPTSERRVYLIDKSQSNLFIIPDTTWWSKIRSWFRRTEPL
jgi:hypothetical protein